MSINIEFYNSGLSLAGLEKIIVDVLSVKDPGRYMPLFLAGRAKNDI